MILGRVIGTVVSTRKDERLTGYKLLVVEPLKFKSGIAAPDFVAVDTLGAGVGETVLVVKGSTASRQAGDGDLSTPVDAAIVGIVDMVELSGNQ
ncbi:MAG: EutN/CcmL family microcompartment protein [Eubacteriales bacterium]